MTKRTRRTVTDQLLAGGRELSTAAVMFHSVLAEKQGLSVTEEKALDLLDRFGPLTAGELSEKSGLAPPSITGLVNRLEKKGFVKRAADESDGRKVRVQIVEGRLAAFVPLFVDFMADLEALCASFSIEQLEAISRFVREAARRQQAAAIKLSGTTGAHAPVAPKLPRGR